MPHVRVNFNPFLGCGGNAGKRDFAEGWSNSVNELAATANAEPEEGKTGKERRLPVDGIDDRLETRALLQGTPIEWILEK